MEELYSIKVDCYPDRQELVGILTRNGYIVGVKQVGQYSWDMEHYVVIYKDIKGD